MGGQHGKGKGKLNQDEEDFYMSARDIDLVNSTSSSIKPSMVEIHKEKLLPRYGERGVEILREIEKNHTGNPNQKDIAKAVNCTPRTVRKYQKKFKEDPGFLLEVFNVEK